MVRNIFHASLYSVKFLGIKIVAKLSCVGLVGERRTKQFPKRLAVRAGTVVFRHCFSAFPDVFHDAVGVVAVRREFLAQSAEIQLYELILNERQKRSVQIKHNRLYHKLSPYFVPSPCKEVSFAFLRRSSRFFSFSLNEDISSSDAS